MAQEVTNFARFYGILKERFTFASKELGDEFKESVVSQFTNRRTTSLREMTRKEYDMMCDKLEGVTAKLIRTAKDVQRKHRSQCLRLMQKLGLDTTDWTRINAFCQDPRIAGKVFSQLSNEELEQLSVKLRAISRKGGFAQRKSAGNGGCSALGAGNGGGSALSAGNGGCSALGAGNGGGSALGAGHGGYLLVPLDEEGGCS